MKLTRQIVIGTKKTIIITKLNFFLSLLFLVFFISCKENSTQQTDTDKPTVAILYPANGVEVKADTVYKIIADAIDNKGIVKVEFYIDGQNVSSDNSSPYEYIWNTTGLSGDHTIMAKGYDAKNNIGTSSVISVKIKGAANHAPASPSNPNPLNAAIDVSTSPILSWSCIDPEGDALTYNVYFGTSSNPTITLDTNQTAASINRSGLIASTSYYWKIVAKDSKGATTTGPVWSFITTNPPAVPSNPNPTDAATGVSTSPILSWSCSDPDGDALTYDVYFGTASNPTTTFDTNQTAASISRIGLPTSTTYYWKIVAKDSKGATTTGPVWSFTTSVISQDLVQITGGVFSMGSNDANDYGASPPHSVTLGSFSIDKYEITYEKWTDIRNWGLTHGYTDLPVGQNGYNPRGSYNPITNVNWYDILKWCNARSEKDGFTPVYYTNNALSIVYKTGQLDLAADAVKWTANGYRLPTEAEWEFAARGGTSSQGYIYSGSNMIDGVAWYYSNSPSTSHTVGTKSANELGIYDMSGNVMEWCWDWYGTYSSTAQIDPKGPTSITTRVLRGGSFAGYDYNCRVACRYNYKPDVRYNYDGFRCVKN